MKFRQINEAFDWVMKGDNKADRTARLMEIARNNQVIVPVVKLGVGADKLDWKLPEGRPEKAKIQEDIPEGMGESTLTLEWRRIKGFIEEGSNMSNLPDWKREMVWLQILEGVHQEHPLLLDGQRQLVLPLLLPALLLFAPPGAARLFPHCRERPADPGEQKRATSARAHARFLRKGLDVPSFPLHHTILCHPHAPSTLHRS